MAGPLELAKQLNKNPFNENRVSHEKGREYPFSFFANESKRLVNMSPNDYFKFVSHMANTTPEKLIEHRQNHPNEMSVDDMRSLMKKGTKFDTPWLRVDDYGEPRSVSPYWQEGLHRMLAAGQEYGMDTKFPIYLAYENDPWEELDTMSMDDFIKHYDDTRLKRYNARKEREKEQELEYKKDIAEWYNIPLDAVLPKVMKKYDKEMTDLFDEDLDY